MVRIWITPHQYLEIFRIRMFVKVTTENLLTMLSIDHTILYLGLFISITDHTEGTLKFSGGCDRAFQISDMCFIQNAIGFPYRESLDKSFC